MNEQESRRNISLYRLYTIFSEPLFWGPIIIMSLQNLGHMSLPSIYYQESAVLCLCVVLDIPAGILADRIGRKKVLIIGRLFLFGSTLVLALMNTPLEAWAANVLWAFGFSLQSGSDMALLYDTLRSRGRQSEFKRIEGGAVGMRFALMAVSSLATGLLASIAPRLPIALSIPFILIPLTAACFFKEPVRTEEHSVRQQTSILKEGVRAIRRSVEVRWMIGFTALLATIGGLWFFSYNPYFELVKLPVVWYGVVFFCLNVIAWISSHYAHRIEKRLGERACIIGMVLCLGAPILAMGLLPILPFAFLVLIQNVVRGFTRPFVGDYLNRHIRSEVRATVLSMKSTFTNVISVFGLALFGFAIHKLGLADSLTTLGITSLLLGALSYRSYAKRNRGTVKVQRFES